MLGPRACVDRDALLRARLNERMLCRSQEAAIANLVQGIGLIINPIKSWKGLCANALTPSLNLSCFGIWQIDEGAVAVTRILPRA